MRSRNPGARRDGIPFLKLCLMRDSRQFRIPQFSEIGGYGVGKKK